MKVGVIGAGTMGQGIAKAFAQVEGFTVALCDIKQEWAEGGKNKIAAGYAKLVAKGKLDQAEVDRRMAAITAGLKEDLCADCDLIVEAAFEDMKVKQTTFGELDKICKPECIFASNTSSISMTSLAAATSRPEKVVGMHFFSPVPKMKLCEVIFGLLTEQDVLDSIKAVGERMGKTLILADDKPGFIVNRALLPMLNEAVQVLDEDIGTVEDVDEGMMRGCNHPMGPLALADMIGLDILLEVMETFYLDLGDTKYRPAHLLRKMVSAGYLGRKSGAGFYVYDEGKKIGVNPVLVKA